jgi:hypothetical protein
MNFNMRYGMLIIGVRLIRRSPSSSNVELKQQAQRRKGIRRAKLTIMTYLLQRFFTRWLSNYFYSKLQSFSDRTPDNKFFSVGLLKSNSLSFKRISLYKLHPAFLGALLSSLSLLLPFILLSHSLFFISLFHIYILFSLHLHYLRCKKLRTWK